MNRMNAALGDVARVQVRCTVAAAARYFTSSPFTFSDLVSDLLFRIVCTGRTVRRGPCTVRTGSLGRM